MGSQSALLIPAVCQVSLAQNNPYIRVACFGMAHSATLQRHCLPGEVDL